MHVEVAGAHEVEQLALAVKAELDRKPQLGRPRAEGVLERALAGEHHPHPCGVAAPRERLEQQRLVLLLSVAAHAQHAQGFRTRLGRARLGSAGFGSARLGSAGFRSARLGSGDPAHPRLDKPAGDAVRDNLELRLGAGLHQAFPHLFGRTLHVRAEVVHPLHKRAHEPAVHKRRPAQMHGVGHVLGVEVEGPGHGFANAPGHGGGGVADEERVLDVHKVGPLDSAADGGEVGAGEGVALLLDDPREQRHAHHVERVVHLAVTPIGKHAHLVACRAEPFHEALRRDAHPVRLVQVVVDGDEYLHALHAPRTLLSRSGPSRRARSSRLVPRKSRGIIPHLWRISPNLHTKRGT